MGNRFIAFIKHSKIAKLTIAVIATIIILTIVIPLICHSVYIGVMANLMTLIFQIAFALAAIVVALIFAKMEIYKKHTDGRNLIADQRMYGRDQIDLMDHFKRDPRKLDVTTMPARPWTLCDGLIFGKKDGRTICRPSSADGNALLFAAPGVGKTMGQVIPSALRFRGSVFAIDVKGDISAYTKGRRKIKFFDPDDINSCHFDPLSSVRTADSSTRGLAIEKLANILIPRTSTGDGEYFDQGAYDIFCGIVNFHFAKNNNVTFPQIVNSILKGNAIKWVEKIQSSNIDNAKKYTDNLYGQNERNVAGCYGKMCTLIRPLTTGNLSTLLTPSDNVITPADLESGTDVYLKVSQEHLTEFSSCVSIIVDDFLSAFKSRSRPDVVGNRQILPILFLLDEAGVALRHLSADSIADSLATLRSRKITTMLVFQSRSQMISRYGIHGSAVIMDTCRYVSVMSATDPDSAKFFSEMIGKQKSLKSSGSSSIEAEEYIIPPEKMSDLGDQLVILADGKYIVADKIKCWQDIRPASEAESNNAISPLKINPDYL